MGAHAWVDEMRNDLGEEFDLSEGQAFRLVSLVRKFNSDPMYEGVTGENGSEQWIEMKRVFFDELPVILRDQSGDTLEERWNNLMDEMDIQSRAEKGVYLEPWSEETDSKMDDLIGRPSWWLPGVHKQE